MSQDFAGESSSRRLPIGASDGDDTSLQITRGEFDFPDDLDTELACLGEAGRVHGYAGADDDEVLIAERSLAVNAGLDGNTFVQELRDESAQLPLRLRIRDGDARSA